MLVRCVLILLVLTITDSNVNAQGTRVAAEGILDLSSVDFEGKEIRLDSDWEFYWNKLILPEGFKNQKKDYYSVPKSWRDGITHHGEKLANKGVATYRLLIILPKKTPPLALSIGKINSAYTFLYNGIPIIKNGTVSTDEDKIEESWMSEITPIARLSDTVEFVIQLANYRHAKGGIIDSIVIGDRKRLLRRRHLVYFFEYVILGNLLMGGIFFLGLYFFGNKERTILIFSSLCIASSYYIIGSGYYEIYSLVPKIPWEYVVRLELISLLIPLAIYAEFNLKLFSGSVNKRVFSTSKYIFFSLAVLVLFLPVFYITNMSIISVILAFSFLFSVLYAYIKVLKKKDKEKSRGVLFFLVGMGVFIVAISYYLFDQSSFVAAVIVFFSVLLFFFLQSLSISFRFAYFLKEAKVKAEAASEARTNFLNTISHEIRTPLNAVIGIANFLSHDLGKKNRTQNLESLKFSAQYLLSIINDILDFSKLNRDIEYESVPVDLNNLSNQIVNTSKGNLGSKNVELLLEFDGKINTYLLLDPMRIHQVLNNLLFNSIKFTEEGYVKVKLSLLKDYSDRQDILFEIIDTGIGIDKKYHKVIFDSFKQATSSTKRKFGGTGLGLAIIKKILQKYNTEVHIESEVGKGSNFYFQLTLKKPDQSIKKNISRMDEEELDDDLLKDKKILLVEDNQMNVMVAKKVLKHWNLKVDVANNGLVAVEKVKKSNDYDLILMDLQMPEMDGYEASLCIKKDNPHIPIIALTADTMFDIRKKVSSSKMDDIVSKPFDTKLLKKIIYLHLLNSRNKSV